MQDVGEWLLGRMTGHAQVRDLALARKTFRDPEVWLLVESRADITEAQKRRDELREKAVSDGERPFMIVDEVPAIIQGIHERFGIYCKRRQLT